MTTPPERRTPAHNPQVGHKALVVDCPVCLVSKGDACRISSHNGKRDLTAHIMRRPHLGRVLALIDEQKRKEAERGVIVETVDT